MTITEFLRQGPQVKDVLPNKLRIEDVIVPFHLMQEGYYKQLEPHLRYQVKCTECRQRDEIPYAELLTWGACLHRKPENLKKSYAFHLKFSKMPSDNEWKQWISYISRHRKERLSDADMTKIRRQNPNKFNF